MTLLQYKTIDRHAGSNIWGGGGGGGGGGPYSYCSKIQNWGGGGGANPYPSAALRDTKQVNNS